MRLVFFFSVLSFQDINNHRYPQISILLNTKKWVAPYPVHSTIYTSLLGKLFAVFPVTLNMSCKYTNSPNLPFFLCILKISTVLKVKLSFLPFSLKLLFLALSASFCIIMSLLLHVYICEEIVHHSHLYRGTDITYQFSIISFLVMKFPFFWILCSVLLR